MANAVAQKAREEIGAGVVAQIKHHFLYLSQYHDNIENLRSKVRILEGKIEDVQDKIEAARCNLRESKDGVNDWLTRGKDIKEEAEKILEDEDKVGNGCWKGWCLNLKLRYRLSREAVEGATPKIETLLQELAQFETVALYRRPSAVVRDDDDKKKKKKTNDEIVEIQEDENSDKAAGASAIAWWSSSGAGGGLESRESTLREVMEAVKDDQICMVRICGMGGVGKTTMVNQVEKLARNQRLFDEIPKVEFTDKPNYGLIQSNLAKSLGFFDLEKVEDELSARARELHKRLNDESKKILLIADNVWKREDLEGVGILRENKNSRCKILLTSRNDDVCELLMEEKVFKIGVLPEPEAMNLFYHSLGNSIFFEQIAKDIVKACSGLPLAIKTIARAVANKDEDDWKVSLMRLQDPTTSGGEYEAVFKTLKVSYDFLKNEKIKKLFRLCCLFPKGAYLPIECLARYGMALRLFSRRRKLYEEREQAQVDIKTLVRSNLLVKSDDIDCVHMHDLVWDFALSLSSEGAFMVKFGDGVEESQTRDSYTSISLQFDNQAELPEGLNFHNLEILQLVANWCSLPEIPDNFFEGMGGLLVLFLEGIDAPLSVKSLQHLAKLRSLHLVECVLKSDVSMIGNFDKLEVLSLAVSNIKQFPTEIGKLRGLRLLDLTYCRSLKSIAPGILSDLTCLEELYTGGIDWDEKEFEATFIEISSLPKLLVIVIKMPIKFQPPVDSLFKKVEKFMISFGGYLEGQKKYRFHNTLSFGGGSDVVLDGIFKLLLGKTESMDLEGAGGLQVLVDDAETGQFSNMKTLSVNGCLELVYLVNARHLHQRNVFPLLGSLSLSDLVNLEEIYHVQNSKESFIEFANLKYLCLYRLNNLVAFCKDAYEVELPQLEELELHSLPKLTSLCSGAETLASEEDHNSASCPLFNQKGTHVRGFQNLRSVKVENCDSLRQLFTLSVAISFRELHLLELYSCKSLEAIVAAEGRKEEDIIANMNIKQKGTTVQEVCYIQLLLNISNFVVIALQFYFIIAMKHE